MLAGGTISPGGPVTDTFTASQDHALVSLEGPKDIITEQLDERGMEYEVYDYEAVGDDLLWKYDKKAAKKKQKAKEKADKKKAESEEEGECGSCLGKSAEL